MRRGARSGRGAGEPDRVRAEDAREAGGGDGALEAAAEVSLLEACRTASACEAMAESSAISSLRALPRSADMRN